MKTEKTLYIVDSRLIDSLPEYYEGQYIEIEIELIFSRSEDDFHGEKNVCIYDYEISSIYVRERIEENKRLGEDLTDTLNDIVVDLINKTNII